MLSWSQEMLPARQHFGASRSVAVLWHYKNVAYPSTQLYEAAHTETFVQLTVV